MLLEFFFLCFYKVNNGRIINITFFFFYEYIYLKNGENLYIIENLSNFFHYYVVPFSSDACIPNLLYCLHLKISSEERS